MSADKIESIGSNKTSVEEYICAWSEVKLQSQEDVSRKKDKQICEFLERLVLEKEKLAKKTEKIKEKILSENKDSGVTIGNLRINDGSKQENSILCGNYKNRFQAQKQIIALQKAKLEEQKRFIEDLKLNKIIENAQTTDVLSNVKISFKNCSNTVKPRLKYVLGEANSSETSYNDTLKVNCLKVPKFYQKMEARAKEREERRAVVMERKRQIELEKEKMKQQMLLEKQILDQEEKERRVNEFKEKRRQAQLVAIRRKHEREQMRALFVMADLHYEKELIQNYGIRRWKLYVQNIKNDNLKAEKFNTDRIIRYHFVMWKEIVRKDLKEKNNKANHLYNITLKYRMFAGFKKVHREAIYKMQIAEDWYDLCITNKIFTYWINLVIKMKKHYKKQEELAVIHYEWQLKWKVIGYWQTLPMINALERKREARKRIIRLKVQEVVPDYIPRVID